jgi:preprotein translocase subunit Sss1
MKEEKKVIVEFIEEGTDRVIRTCTLEEYNNMIESINNTIPKEYKFLKTKKQPTPK